jgi:hypothetical protein
MNFRLKNPSEVEFRQNLKITLNVADGMPNEDGSMGEGSRIITALTQPTVNIVKTGSDGTTNFDAATGILTVEELAPGEELQVEFVIIPPEGISSYWMIWTKRLLNIMMCSEAIH